MSEHDSGGPRDGGDSPHGGPRDAHTDADGLCTLHVGDRVRIKRGARIYTNGPEDSYTAGKSYVVRVKSIMPAFWHEMTRYPAAVSWYSGDYIKTTTASNVLLVESAKKEEG